MRAGRLPKDGRVGDPKNVPGGSKLVTQVARPHPRARGTGRAGARERAPHRSKRVFAPAAADSDVLVFKVRGRGSAPGRGAAISSGAASAGPSAPSASGPRPGAAFSGCACRAAWSARAARARTSPAGRARLVVLVADEDDLGRSACGSSSVTRGTRQLRRRQLARRLLAPVRGRLARSTSVCPRRPRLDPRSDAIVRRVTGWGEPAELRAGVAGTRGRLAAPDLLPEPERSGVRDPLHRGAGAPARSRACRSAFPTRPAPPAGSRRAPDGRRSGQRLGVRLLAGAAQARAAAGAW